MRSRKRLTAVIAVILALLVAGGVALLVRQAFFKPKTITAYFTSATAIYPGDEVRVAGVKVGTIKSIQAQGTRAKMSLAVDRDVPIPANAEAVIVSQNLVGARYVQLTPPYEDSGPTMSDGAVIGLDRTAVPGRVGRGQGPADAPGHRSRARRTTPRPPRSAGSSTPRPPRWTATGRSCTTPSRSCPASAGYWPTAAATSSTSSRTCRPS